MISCYVRYEVDPSKLKEFETYAKMWLPLVMKLGGTHHGYFLPHDGGTFAIALFSFPTMADFEAYGAKRESDPDCQRAMAYLKETKCFVSYEWSFLRPVFDNSRVASANPEAG